MKKYRYIGSGFRDLVFGQIFRDDKRVCLGDGYFVTGASLVRIYGEDFEEVKPVDGLIFKGKMKELLEGMKEMIAEHGGKTKVFTERVVNHG